MTIPQTKSTTRALGALGALAAIGVLALVAPAGATTGTPLPQGGEPVNLDPADFTRTSTTYWPMRPGSRWVYRETDAQGPTQQMVVTVTHRTKTIANGVEARVVHDVVSERGEPVEDTATGTPRTRAATSGTSARTPRSTRTARSPRPTGRSRPASTAPRPA